MTRRAVVGLAAAAALVAVGAGCGKDEARPEDGRGEAVSPPEAEALPAQAAPEAAPAPAPVAGEEAPESPARPAAGATKPAAARFKNWAPVHAFLGVPVVLGRVVSPTEAVALTKDGHVGVTSDGGRSWGFIKHDTATVTAVAGTPGGPFVAVGKGGYIALSDGGKAWTEVPRYTADDMVDVAILNGSVVAIGKIGTFVAVDPATREAKAGVFPDKFKPAALHVVGTQLVATKGKTAYASSNGTTWAALDVAPSLPDGRSAMTSRGVCKLGKVGKAKGIACEVSGLAYGLDGSTAFVDGKKTLAFTRDGGQTWAVAEMPVSGLSKVIGASGGPWYALGGKGGLASTRDGRSWSEVPLNATKTLRDGIVDGSTIVIVGDGGTIVRSTNGGESWEVLPAPTSGAYKQIAKIGDQLAIPAGKKAIVSGDGGSTWMETDDPAVIEAIPAVAKPGTCEGRMPAAGEACKVKRETTTPLGLPNVRSFDFDGDVGLAMGDNGLVAFTRDGGASWEAQSGFSLKKLQGFEARGTRVVAVGGKSVIVSVDGGATFKEAQLPKKAGAINDVLIAEDGAVYASGKGGTILKAEGSLDLWLMTNTGEKNRTDFVFLHEAGGVIYASGSKGELYRTRDGGATWVQVPTGISQPIQAVSADGNTVVALTLETRKGGNLLLVSKDGGYHFYVQREISDQGRADVFALAGGVLTYEDRVSDDFGATWTKADGVYWHGAVDVADGSGLRLVARNSYYGKDPLFLIGQDKDDWTVIDSAYAEGAWLRCDKTSGCWMVTGGQIYRPL